MDAVTVKTVDVAPVLLPLCAPWLYAGVHAAPHAVVIATLLELRSFHVAFRRFVRYLSGILCVFILTVLEYTWTVSPVWDCLCGSASIYAVWTC